MTKGNNKVCDFHDCVEPICEDSKEIKQGLRFCQAHDDKCTEHIRSENIPGLLTFWVRSHGGAERMSQSI